MKSNVYIMIFKNTTDTMKAQRVFEKNNFQYNIMPTPSGIIGSCGMSLIFTEEVYEKLKSIDIQYKEIYIKVGLNFELVQ